MKRLLPICLLWLTAGWAHAGVGLAELPGQQSDDPVTVYYPSSGQNQPTRLGPFSLPLDRQGKPVRGNGRLIVISHGSGSAPWSHADLARTLVEAGFVVAAPLHRGDNYQDNASAGPVSWKRRPAEVSRAIDAVAADARFAPLLKFDKVGVYGVSAGGHTALTLAGGRWSPARYSQHCHLHIAQDFPACAGAFTRLEGNYLDAMKKASMLALIRQRFSDPSWQTHADARVAAVVAGVPLAAGFDMASFAALRAPLGLITAGQDQWLAPRFHSERVLAACKRCTLVAGMPNAGHGALLSPPPAKALSRIAADLLADPPGFDRSVLPGVDRSTAAFFSQHLPS